MTSAQMATVTAQLSQSLHSVYIVV